MFNERLGTECKLKEGIYHEVSSQKGNFELREMLTSQNVCQPVFSEQVTDPVDHFPASLAGDAYYL